MAQKLDSLQLSAFLKRHNSQNTLEFMRSLNAPELTSHTPQDSSEEVFPGYGGLDPQAQEALDTVLDKYGPSMQGGDRAELRHIQAYVLHGDYTGMFNSLLLMGEQEAADACLLSYFRQQSKYVAEHYEKVETETEAKPLEFSEHTIAAPSDSPPRARTPLGPDPTGLSSASGTTSVPPEASD
jgi:hypothetical protein